MSCITKSAQSIASSFGHVANVIKTGAAASDLRVCFVHTPMSSVEVKPREVFWRNFDERYYAVHPGQKPADAGIWELPHWIPWLAGVLKAKGFAHVSAMKLYPAVDLKTGIDPDWVTREALAVPADVYLYSPMTPNLHNAYAIASQIKKIYPTSLNVFGGVVATPLHTTVALHPAVDYVVRDRGELALPNLLHRLAKKQSLEDLPNLTFRKEDGLHSNPHLFPYIPPEEIPLPIHDIFPKETGEKLRYIRQNYALGCPFTCSFCTIQTIGRKTSYFPIERVIQEIALYRNHYGKHHGIYFGDETFTLNNERTLAICKALKSAGTINYDIQTRLMSLNNVNVIKALSESGCKWVEVGIETLVEKSMKIHKQSTNLIKIKDMLKRLRDHNLPVCSFIVNGLPEQTIDEMRYSVDRVTELLDENLLHATYFFGLVPYPGSSMYKEPEKYGLRIRTHDYRYYNEDLEPVYDTAYAKSDEIYTVFLAGVKQLGEAMNKQSYLGQKLSPEVKLLLGKSLTHV